MCYITYTECATVVDVAVCRVTEKWTTAAPMSNKRGDFAAAVLSGRLIVAGGLSESCLSVCLSVSAVAGLEFYETRCREVAGSRLWNSLPHFVTSAPTLAVFRKRLKTYLFSRSFAL